MSSLTLGGLRKFLLISSLSFLIYKRLVIIIANDRVDRRVKWFICEALSIGSATLECYVGIYLFNCISKC